MSRILDVNNYLFISPKKIGISVNESKDFSEIYKKEIHISEKTNQINFGLINVFKIYPLLQEILKVSGSLFLVYLAYKIAFSKNQTENKKENPVKFFDTFFFQFLNPKGVIVGIIIVSTYVESGNNFINYSFWVILVSFTCALISITFWTFVGKFFRRFATNEKFIKIFNYAMASLLLACIGTFYL